MIIKSILDTDLYKFTMGQIAYFKYKDLIVKYRFIDRDNLVYPKGFAYELNKEIKLLSNLKLTPNQKKFLLTKCKMLTPEYVEFIDKYKFDYNEVDLHQDGEGHLIIGITGLWYRTILWETVLMPLISELYFIKTKQIVDIYSNEIKQRDINKIKQFEENGVEFIDMGTRRRYSLENHMRVLKLFKEVSLNSFKGTSNVFLAKELGISTFGSVAHEFPMVMACLYGVENANKKGMDVWLDSYPEMDTFLPDTYTTDVYLRDYKGEYLDKINTLRQDSGKPTEFANKLINHYTENDIVPLTKNIVFSDALNTQKAIDIKKYCEGKINVLPFGIGTFITNDIKGINPLNMVIKISHVFVDGKFLNAVKLSDDPKKSTGDINTVNEYKRILNIE